MDRTDSPTPLLTIEDVRNWVRERDALKLEQEHLAERRNALETRLSFAAMLMPREQAAEIIGEIETQPATNEAVKQPNYPTPNRRSSKKRTLTDGILAALSGEKGGRTPSWIRDRTAEDPDLYSKVTSHAVSNALGRLYERQDVVRLDGRYYLPKLWEEIESGLVTEEHIENKRASNFTSMVMDVAKGLDKPFEPSDLRKAAAEDPHLREKVESNPNSINSWIARRVEKGEIVRQGRCYRFPSEKDDRPDNEAGDMFDGGEGVVSPDINRRGFDDHLR